MTLAQLSFKGAWLLGSPTCSRLVGTSSPPVASSLLLPALTAAGVGLAPESPPVGAGTWGPVGESGWYPAATKSRFCAEEVGLPFAGRCTHRATLNTTPRKQKSEQCSHSVLAPPRRAPEPRYIHTCIHIHIQHKRRALVQSICSLTRAALGFTTGQEQYSSRH